MLGSSSSIITSPNTIALALLRDCEKSMKGTVSFESRGSWTWKLWPKVKGFVKTPAAESTEPESATFVTVLAFQAAKAASGSVLKLAVPNRHEI